MLGIAGFLFSLLLNAVTKRLFLRSNLLDQPDAKLKNHFLPVPFSGGAAIFLACGIFVLLAGLFCGFSYPFFPVISLFFMLGFVDDVFSLAQWQKFLVHLLLLLACFSIFLPGYSIKAWELVFMLAVVNAFNLIDVFDGLCGTISLLAAANFGLLALLLGKISLAYYFLTLAAVVGGFLCFNLPPARSYLGDGGSTFLGANFAIIPFLLPWPTLQLKLGCCLTVLALPLAEVAMLVAIRSYLGLAPFRGSPHHFVHFLLAKGWGRWKILAFVFLAGLVLGVCSVGLLLQAISIILLPLLLFLGFCIWLLVVYL